ncbi:ribulose-phosphate 3-epimerase [Microvenator marinus]|jgi:ribulose-phosphate 3-epimerase|uniref:Ribulose-phosphate 3-epimerase n=1 Tax=Microvenator marinus TaxID=2600177 RepID=A0A5B8XSZ9_9DELT|nr:ribulose-phosphate 3-epimerase [Microvenator marinus]QED27183.1 ribulose-phosphate 3-epimerase [Microvenator marinus]
MTSPILIAPSILASDFARLKDECQAVLDGGADWLHVDVMDGHFVPNLTIGLPVVEALRHHFPDVFLDVHIMISNPDDMAEAYAKAGADLVSFHPEVSKHPHRIIQALHQAGAKASLAINPGTPLDVVDYLAEDLDMVLIMSVNPGFGGQKFIPSTIRKLQELRQKLAVLGKAEMDVQVDGGVNTKNIGQICAAGANILVAGSAIFNTDDYAATISKLRSNASGA